jgi:hypothetical protein
VETDGRQAKPGGRGIEGEDNVVRLPRDWLGPREDLIPFGPSAEAHDETLATPPSTHDFWGEGAADPWELEPDGAVADPPRPSRWRVPKVIVPNVMSHTYVRARLHGRGAGLTVLAAVCVAVVLFAVGGRGQRSQPRTASVATHQAPTQTSVADLTPGPALPTLPARTRRAAVRRSSRSVLRLSRPRTKVSASHRRSPSGKPPVVQSVRYNPPPASSSTSVVSPSRAAPTASAPVSQQPQASAAQSSRSPHQPALGAAGALAPGSSPDS